MALPTLEEAIADSCGTSKPHALLGNGFSRACRDDIFAYQALFEQADFGTASPYIREAFNALGTQDFEIVMRALRQASALARVYASDHPALSAQLQTDADQLRDLLVSTIARSHPSWPGEIEAHRYEACKKFLKRFSRIYTLNYDLLLYWAVMQSELPPPVDSDDGFRSSDDPSVDYVVWEPSESHGQTINYVHVALHLFDTGSELVKFTWSKTHVRLLDQIREALSVGKYPLFVAEGDSQSKLRRIRHHAYLAKAERAMLSIQGTLVVYGMSFGDSDAHILRWLLRGKLKGLLVSLYGDPDSPSNRALRERVAALAAKRHTKHPLSIAFFDAASAAAWG